MDLGEVGWGGVDWLGVARDTDRWRTLVNSVLNLRAGKLSNGLGSRGLSSSAQLHRVSQLVSLVAYIHKHKYKKIVLLGTMLKSGRSGVRDSMRQFSSMYLTLPAALGPGVH
jgi:hypothetical protein